MFANEACVSVSQRSLNRVRFVFRIQCLFFFILFAYCGLSGAADAAATKTHAAAGQRSAPLKPQSAGSLPMCPRAGIPAGQGSGQYSSHKVVLAWEASPRTPKAQSFAVGYCIYRSNSREVQKMPTCKECQQLNTKPVAATSCVDDRVQENKTYYYVVTAVNANGDPSAPTKGAMVHVSKEKKDKSAPEQSSLAPLCRSN